MKHLDMEELVEKAAKAGLWTGRGLVVSLKLACYVLAILALVKYLRG